MAQRILTIACWVLLGGLASFILIIVSPLRNILRIPGDLSNNVGYLAVLGTLLVILASMTKMSPWLRTFLITAGASSAGWIIGVFLHTLLFRLFPTEPVTYVFVFFVLPVTFLIGVSGAIIIGIKQLFNSKQLRG